VLGRAPEDCEQLPDPDSVFIAGRRPRSDALAEAAYERLRPGGRLVVNTTSVDHVAELRQTMGQHSSDVRVWLVNFLSRTDQLGRLTFEPVKPCFLLAVTKA